ncbi:MAG: VWA domain-containing protein, partial [Planctomycetes bacterium]|nr:VWA domain-containing protein [Planctomycetota bacterium]
AARAAAGSNHSPPAADARHGHTTQGRDARSFFPKGHALLIRRLPISFQPLTTLSIAALVLVAVVIGGASSASADLKGFKKAWGRASKQAGEGRTKAQLAALEMIKAEDDAKLARLLPALALDTTFDYRVRDAAEDALSRLAGPGVDVWFAESLGASGKRAKEKHPGRRVVLCHVLGRRAGSDAAARKVLLAALKDPDASVATAALRGVRELKEKDVVTALVGVLSSAQGRLEADCRAALKRLTGEAFASAAEWQSYWEAKGSAWDPNATPGSRETEASGERHVSTRTRLEPPKGGKTIYGEVTSSRVLFVVDVSGSMQVRAKDTTDRLRTRLDYVRLSLAGVIESQLTEKDQFNILSFSSSARLFSKKKKLLKGNAANKKRAASWIRSLQPEDGTNVYLALQRAFEVKGGVDTIYFLSDGSPSEGASIVTDEILGHVRRWNSGRGVRIHTIGFLVGDGKNLGIVQNKGMAKRFLQALAKDNDGSARFFE